MNNDNDNKYFVAHESYTNTYSIECEDEAVSLIVAPKTKVASIKELADWFCDDINELKKIKEALEFCVIDDLIDYMEEGILEDKTLIEFKECVSGKIDEYFYNKFDNLFYDSANEGIDDGYGLTLNEIQKKYLCGYRFSIRGIY